MRRDTIDQLTSLRGIAALIVMFYHLAAYLDDYVAGSVIAVLEHGNLAVDFFFVLSGFVLYLNYAERVEPTFSSLMWFMKRRFARIYPLHFLILTGFFLYVFAGYLARGSWWETYSVDYLIMSYLLVQNVGFTNTLEWNVPAWSISTEMVAYLVFPFLIAGLALKRRGTPLLFGLIVLMTALLYAFFVVTGWDFPNNISQNGLLRCLTQFIIGLALCELYLRGFGAGRASVIAGIVAVACLALLFRDPDFPVVPIFWSGVILGMTGWTSKNPMQWRPLVYLGDISYAIYLSHYFILTLFKFAFVDVEGEASLAFIAGYVVTVLLVSAALYHFWERPAQHWVLGHKVRPKPLPAP